MAAGSEAAQHVGPAGAAELQFSAMPQIVKEGRRVINNIERSATLFLVKNIFSFVVSLVLLFAAMPYPLVPAQISLLSGLLIGVPSFLLTFEPSYGRVRGSFMRSVLLNALPGGLVNGEPAGRDVDRLRDGPSHGADLHCVHTLLAGTAGFMVLLFLCWPLSRWRFAIVAAMGVGLHRRMRPAGAAVWPFPLSGRADAAGRICRRHSRADACSCSLVSRVKQRLRRSQRAKACRRGCLPHFPEAHFFFISQRAPPSETYAGGWSAFSAPHRPQLEFNSKKTASAFNIRSIVYAALVCYDGTGPKRNERNLPKWKCQPEKPSKHCADKRD